MSHRIFTLSDLALVPGSIVLRRVPTADEQATWRLNCDLNEIGADLLATSAGKPDILTILRRCKAERAAAEKQHALEIAMTTTDNDNDNDTPATANDTAEECPLDLAMVGLPPIKPLVIDLDGELAVDEQIGGMPAAGAVAMVEVKGTPELTAADYLRRLLVAHQAVMPREDWSSDEAARGYLNQYDQWLRVQLKLLRLLG